MAGDDTNDYDVTPDIAQGSDEYPDTPKKNENKLKKNLKKFLYNLAQRSKKNGHRLINRLGRH